MSFLFFDVVLMLCPQVHRTWLHFQPWPKISRLFTNHNGDGTDSDVCLSGLCTTLPCGSTQRLTMSASLPLTWVGWTLLYFGRNYFGTLSSLVTHDFSRKDYCDGPSRTLRPVKPYYCCQLALLFCCAVFELISRNVQTFIPRYDSASGPREELVQF